MPRRIQVQTVKLITITNCRVCPIPVFIALVNYFLQVGSVVQLQNKY